MDRCWVFPVLSVSRDRETGKGSVSLTCLNIEACKFWLWSYKKGMSNGQSHFLILLLSVIFPYTLSMLWSTHSKLLNILGSCDWHAHTAIFKIRCFSLRKKSCLMSIPKGRLSWGIRPGWQPAWVLTVLKECFLKFLFEILCKWPVIVPKEIQCHNSSQGHATPSRSERVAGRELVNPQFLVSFFF